ncbi:sulfotransferase domain-containing protein [Hyunsoonleella rubra]|uniref:Sulfotransferase domain-containing protein n=1 Tax=Hyunsoonleella rubra TaxID=1737062 RepID=A0ABW5TFV6_9FLAO
MKISKSYISNNHFIIAAPRSGTTWMSKMLNAHPDIFCVERRLFGNYADFVQDDGQVQSRLRVTLDKYVSSLILHHGLHPGKTERLMSSLIKSLVKEERAISKKKTIVDKITPYLGTSEHVLHQINTYFPKSKIIYLVRDGRDVFTSGVFHWFNKKQTNTELTDFESDRRDAFKSSKPFKGNRFFQDKEIQQWANEWKEPLQTIERARQTHEVKIISYEDMLKDPTNVVEACLSFFNVKSKPKFVNPCVEAGQFKKMSKGRNQGEAKADAHVRKGIAGDWKNYFTYEDGKLFHEIAGDSLIEYGYVENKNWFEELR